MVGAGDLYELPIHNWYSYKEAYSPKLPAAVLDELGIGDDAQLTVADVFGGVATSALSLQGDRRIRDVRSVEFSPFAHFAGRVKLSSGALVPDHLASALTDLLNFKSDPAGDVPALSTFSDERVFPAGVAADLLGALEAIDSAGLVEQERDFFRLGLAAIVEDASGAMKDGRALRIRGSRARRPASVAARWLITRDGEMSVRSLLDAQWRAMISDVRALRSGTSGGHTSPACHLRGDARALGDVKLPGGEPAFPDGAIDLFCYSPPYLNGIDYTEVYKLELWLLGQVQDQREFRELRLGTLRSHASVKFPETGTFDGLDLPVASLIVDMSAWVTENGRRAEVGPIIRQYFEDMFLSYKEQARALRPRGRSVCVVGNSTYSRRDIVAGSSRVERWRLPVITDVLLAHLALAAGFAEVEIWHARQLRPRNVADGVARESLVVARMPA